MLRPVVVGSNQSTDAYNGAMQLWSVLGLLCSLALERQYC